MKKPVKMFSQILLIACVLPMFATEANAAELYIRVNQLGFTPAGVKTAVVFGSKPLPSFFRIVTADGGTFMFSGKVQPVAGSWGQFA